ncbi:uncharacterized protein LJ206_005033 isoform 2-T2 [Theristicus caerulescens]
MPDILKSSVDFLCCKTSAESFQQLYFMFQKLVKKLRFFKQKKQRSGSTMERWKKNTKAKLQAEKHPVLVVVGSFPPDLSATQRYESLGKAGAFKHLILL